MANTNANITNKLFTYVSHGVDINEDIKEIYQNSLIFIGDEGQIYIPMYNTYIGIGNSRFSNIIDSAVWEKGENTASIQSRDTGAIAKGNYSLAHGKDTRAFGDYSEAGGFESIASGDKSTAIGDRNIALGNSAFAEGSETVAYGIGTHSEGISSYAYGKGSHTEGQFTSAYGVSSHAEGQLTTANGDYSHAEGFRTIAAGDFSHVEGANTYGVAYTHAEGYASYALGTHSHAEGVNTYAKNEGAHSEGHNTKANGIYSHAEGELTSAIGDISHGEGFYTKANGNYSHSEGNSSNAAGDMSHAEGYGSYVKGLAAHAENHSIALGDYSHAEGWSASSYNTYSHAEGLFSKASGDASHAEGKGINVNTTATGEINTTSLIIPISDLTINKLINGNVSYSESWSEYIGAHYLYNDTIETDEGIKNIKRSKVLYFNNLKDHIFTESEINEQNISNYNTYITYNNTYEFSSLLSQYHGSTRTSKIISVQYLNNSYTLTLLNSINPYFIFDGNVNTSSVIITKNSTIGNYSHSEGYENIAVGIASHSEGYSNISKGNYSHTEGFYTYANGDNSHTEGKFTYAQGNNSHTEGELTYAIGINSHSEGYNTYSTGNNSHAEGHTTYATGYVSHAEGYHTYANNEYTHAEGTGTYANGEASHAEGITSKANGNYSHAEGGLTIANGIYAHAEGYSTYTNGSTTHAEGRTTYALGEASHSEGEHTYTYGPASHAEGQYTYTYNTATGSHTEGFNTYTGGNFETNNLTASLNTSRGIFAHAEGNATIAKGPYSHSEGKKTFAKGQNSHAEGDNTVSEGIASHAEGDNTLAYGNASHAEGTVTAANGNYSHTEGVRTIANNEGEHAEGKYNLSTLNKTIHSVGIGTDTNARKNAFEIINDGTSYIINLGNYTHSVIPYYDGTNLNSAVSVQELINTHFEDGLLINQLDPRGNNNFTYAIVGINTYTSTDNQHKISYQILPLPTKKYVDDLIEANDALRYCGTVTPASAANGNITLSHYQTADDPELVNPGHHTTPDTSRGAVYKVSSTGYIGLEYVKAGDMIISYQDNAVANTYVGWDVINENLHLITINPTQAYNPTQNRVLTNVHLTDDGTFSYTYYPLTVQNNQAANNNLAQQSTGGSAFIQQTDLNRLHDVTNIGIPVLTAVELKQTNLTTELSYSYTYIYTNQGHHTYNAGEDTEAGNDPSYVALDMNPFNVMTGISISYDGEISYSYTPVVILDAEHSHGADQGELSYGLNYIKGSTGDTTGVITELYLSSYVDPVSGETHVNTLSYAYTDLSGFEGHTSSNGKDFVISYTQTAKGKISVDFGTFTYENTAVANASHYMSNDSYKFITNANISHDGKLSYQVIDVTITDSYTYNDVQTVNDTPRKFLPTGVYPANKNARSFSYLYDETFAYTYVYTKNNMKYSYQFFNGSEVLNGNSYIFGKVVIKSGDGLGGSVSADLDVGNNAIIRNDASIYGDVSVSKNLSVTNSVELAKTHLTPTNVYSYGVTYLGAKKPSGVSTYWTYVMGSTTIGSDNADYVYLTSRHIDLAKASSTAKVEFSGLNLLWGTI